MLEFNSRTIVLPACTPAQRDASDSDQPTYHPATLRYEAEPEAPFQQTLAGADLEVRPPLSSKPEP